MKKNDFYNESEDENKQMGGFYAEKLSFILAQVGTGQKILDIGCNDGYVGEKLREKGNEVYGIDIDKTHLQKAKKRGLVVKIHDIEDSKLPFEKKLFDVIILGDVIEHVFDTDMVLQHCYAMLKKKGKLIITTPNVASLGRRIMLLFGISPFLEYSIQLSTNGLPSVGHIRYYTFKTLTEQLRYNKFRQIALRGNAISFVLFSSRLLSSIFPTLSTMIMGICEK